MKKKYQGTTRTKRQQLQALRSEFETLRMKSRESVTDYFSRTMAIVNKMRIHGDKTEDVTIVEKILRSMTPKFNFVVSSIEESNDIDELSIDELQSSLLSHEHKINKQAKEEQSLKASIGNHFTPSKEKFEAFAAFKNYKAIVEKEVGSPIKVLRTDRGGEYNSHEFANFCEIHGIKRQLTTAYTPKQNGVSERKNRTILNMVRAYKLYNPSTKKIVISRDVVFDEERFWLWNNSAARQQILVDFDGENEDERQQLVENEQQPIPIATQDEQQPQRARTRPAWMTNYDVTGIDQSEDPLTHFALFSYCDPTTFKAVVKESKWRKAMNEEIAAIERNNT
ncbi:hypothetical protein EZV62_008155 [Acer yangbiense]|uniref:Integrase catalytic domain-containing protein n=1 Tax=Acer yangbiense TaxID=1000413 RepID=A0A5C7IC15_9ROSI|nr:hypothetical protein EZV62_008155 [Acer yangbiense]